MIMVQSRIRTIDEEGIPLLVNGFRLKVYNKPMTREEFTTTMKDTKYGCD
jgi:hypothetical protein